MAQELEQLFGPRAVPIIVPFVTILKRILLKEELLFPFKDIIEEIKSLELQDGITFSGGDPMMQPLACLEIAKKCKELGYNIWCYTGFLFEELLNKPNCLEFLNYVDVLVDGKFDNNLKSYSAKYRGSKNQRIINVKSSLKKKKAVCLREYINKIEVI